MPRLANLPNRIRRRSMINKHVLGFTWLFISSLAVSQSLASRSTGHFVKIGESRVWYEECGAANSAAVVLLHDGLVHSIAWDDVWRPLCAQYHVVRYDRRGYGRSEPAKSEFRPEEDLAQI